jgi:hypothetical protein
VFVLTRLLPEERGKVLRGRWELRIGTLRCTNGAVSGYIRRVRVVLVLRTISGSTPLSVVAVL